VQADEPNHWNDPTGYLACRPNSGHASTSAD
jgi:hypothetical protein